MKKSDQITVLMPVFNADQYIGYAVRSILEQTFDGFEFLIIDDGSTDNTIEIIKSFSDPRIRLIERSHSGLAESLNFGLKEAEYDIIARMDADDIAAPERLERQIEYYLGKNENVILSCKYAVFNGSRLWFGHEPPLDHKSIREKLSLHSELTHSGIIYNRNFILGNGGYKNTVFEDYELWTRLMDKAEFINMDETLMFCRIRNDSLSRADITQKDNTMYEIQEEYYKDPVKSFGIDNEEEIRGWREFYYGNKDFARVYWKNCKRDLRLRIATLMTYLPQKLFIFVREMRPRLRLKYIFTYFSKKNITLRKKLSFITR